MSNPILDEHVIYPSIAMFHVCKLLYASIINKLEASTVNIALSQEGFTFNPSYLSTRLEFGSETTVGR